MKCQICYGKGGWDENMGEGTHYWDACTYCEGEGKVSIWKWLSFYIFQLVPDKYWDLIYKLMHKGKQDVNN
jgi:DnaJ-class molecular chaperone